MMKPVLRTSRIALLSLLVVGGVGLAVPAMPVQAQTLRVGRAEDPDLLDPTRARTFVGRIVFSALCDKLFDIDEKQHAEISRLRHNIYALHEYIRAEGSIASANHMFQNYRMRNSPRRYFDAMLGRFDLFEVKNGTTGADR